MSRCRRAGLRHSHDQDGRVDAPNRSQRVPELYGYDLPAFKMAADLVKNFLSYVLTHDVCPEYKDNVLAARAICDIAATEHEHIHELMVGLPGDFNKAASHLFCNGGVHDLDREENYKSLAIFRLGIVFDTSRDEASKTELLSKAAAARVIQTREETYQVVDISHPRKKEADRHASQIKDEGYEDEVKPVGFVVLKPSIIEHGYTNIPRPDEVDLSTSRTETFLLEEQLLAKLKKGMKLQMTVCELDVGFEFIKEIADVRCSFDTFLPQMLMVKWREPEPNERPAPSAAQPQAEEEAFQGLEDGDE